MAETADILESVPYFLKLGAKKVWVDYDEEVDVLYVGFRRPQKATDSRMENDLIYHYREEELVTRFPAKVSGALIVCWMSIEPSKS